MKWCRGGRRPPPPARRHQRAGSRKSSPACRCPKSMTRSIRPVRHRARRGRRHLPAHAGLDSPSAPGTPSWHRAAGRAGRSGCRREADRAAPCRAWLRRAPAVRAAPATRVARRSGRAPPLWRSLRIRLRSARQAALHCRSRFRAAPTIGARVRGRRCSRPASATAPSCRRVGGTVRRSSARRLPALPAALPDRLPAKSRRCSARASAQATATWR